MIIDVHTHIFSDTVCSKRDRYFDDDHFRLLYTGEKSRLVDHRALCAAMGKGGVDHAVALGFPWYSGNYCEEQNRYFSTVEAETAGKLIPFGSVPLEPVSDVAGWVKEINDLGLRGIGEVAFYNTGMDERHTRYLWEILEGARKYRLTVSLHINEPIGHHYTGKYDPGFYALNEILHEFSDVTIIFAHWGGGLLFYELMPKLNKVFTNYYYDTAASPYIYRNDIYTIATGIVGSRKILFGSDYPLLAFSRYIEAVISEPLPDPDKQNILGNSAARIFGLGDQGQTDGKDKNEKRQ